MADGFALLASVVGGGHLASRHGEQESQLALGRCLKRIERAVFAGGGHIVRAVGDDATLARFDEPGQALAAAREVIATVEALPPVAGVRLSARCALDSWGATWRIGPDDMRVRVSYLLVFAPPGQIVTHPETLHCLPPGVRTLASEVGDVPAGAVGPSAEPLKAVAIDWRAWTGADAKGRNSPPGASGPRLHLRCGGSELVLDGRQSRATIGRDRDNDLVVAALPVSRRHASIVRRGTYFVLVDQSTNGTLLAIEDTAAVLVHQAEATLHGSGRLFLCGDDRPDVEFDLVDGAG